MCCTTLTANCFSICGSRVGQRAVLLLVLVLVIVADGLGEGPYILEVVSLFGIEGFGNRCLSHGD
jgi:hypothetical protein